MVGFPNDRGSAPHASLPEDAEPAYPCTKVFGAVTRASQQSKPASGTPGRRGHSGHRDVGLVPPHPPEDPEGTVPASRANQAVSFDGMPRSPRRCRTSRRNRAGPPAGSGSARSCAGRRHPPALAGPGRVSPRRRLELARRFPHAPPGPARLDHMPLKSLRPSPSRDRVKSRERLPATHPRARTRWNQALRPVPDWPVDEELCRWSARPVTRLTKLR